MFHQVFKPMWLRRDCVSLRILVSLIPYGHPSKVVILQGHFQGGVNDEVLVIVRRYLTLLGRHFIARRSGVSKISKVDPHVKNILAYCFSFFPHVNAVPEKVGLPKVPKLI